MTSCDLLYSSLRQRSGQEQIEAIHEAALALLQQHGFDGLTMGAIATQARMSKQTLYKHFKSRELIIIDLVRCNVSDIHEALHKIQDDESRSLHAQLTLVGRGLIRLLTGKKSVLINRIAISYAFTDSRLGQLLFDHGRQTTMPLIAEIIKQGVLSKQSRTFPSAFFLEITESFLGLLLSDLQIQCLLGVASQLSEEDINDRVERAITQLMLLIP